jgi:hypothetical protein
MRAQRAWSPVAVGRPSAPYSSCKCTDVDVVGIIAIVYVDRLDARGGLDHNGDGRILGHRVHALTSDALEEWHCHNLPAFNERMTSGLGSTVRTGITRGRRRAATHSGIDVGGGRDGWLFLERGSSPQFHEPE